MLFLLAACTSSPSDDGSSSALSVEAVTTVGEGDAQGAQWQGQYQTEIYTAACEGACGPVQDGFATVSFCDVGESDTEYLQVEQRDGLLEVEVNDPISFYRGGVYRDDSLIIGGYATEYGGSVEMTALVEGRFEEDGLLATARSYIRGTVELSDGGTVSLDCTGSYELEGVWISELME